MALLNNKTLSKLIACAGLTASGLGFLLDVSGLFDCNNINIYSFEYELKPSIIQHVNFVLCYSALQDNPSTYKFTSLEKYTMK